MYFSQRQNGRLPNYIRILFVVLSAVVLLALFRSIIGKIAVILFGALVFAFLLSPLCSLFEKKLKRSRAALAAILCAAAVLIATIALLFPLVSRQINDLTKLLPESFDRIRIAIERFLNTLQRHAGGLRLPKLNISGMESGLMETVHSIAGAMSGFTGGVYRIFLMISLSYFLMADRDRILLRAELLVPLSWRKLAVRSGNAMIRELRLYLRGQASIALAVGALACLSMVILGIPGAPLLGIIVGIFNVIPYFGPLLGGIPAVVAALSLSWQKALFTIGALFLVQQADGMIISPRIMGSITGFSPAAVLLAVFAGGQLGGIGGMLFALPALLVIRTLYRVFVQRYESN